MPVLRHATTHLGVEQTATGKALGLTNARMMALAAVGAADRCSMTDLARRLSLPAPLATRVADELVARDLVERFGDPGDRRRVVLRLTAQGRAALDTVHGEAEQLVSAVLRRMTENETEALLVGLRAFLRVLHAPAADGAPPRSRPTTTPFRPREPMSHAHAEDAGIVIHGSRPTTSASGRSSARPTPAILAARRRHPRRPRPRRGDRPGLPGARRVALVGPDGSAVGIDASPEMIDRARIRAARAGRAPSTASPRRSRCPLRTTRSTSR